ncbi:adenosylcobinamide-GDP ribazoletransferase [Buttiauxella gaviniae]|uniref:Adenosylcobinamide-GDP ribazoletransferase n=1 Tax=Buttiauxella gaviniae TaxID=82990 RepID=A0ABV3NXZ9_9ENTR
MFRLFFATLQFMSRIPVPVRWADGIETNQYVRGIVTFPFVGLVLGAIAGGIFTLLQPWAGLPLAALGYVLALALITGGFHLDGLADTCDGIFSARTRDRMLEIMRDSRLGTHGGLALIFVIVMKVLVVSELALRGGNMLALLAAASVAGRSASVLLMYRHNYAREKGLGNLFIGKVTGTQTLLTLAGGAGLCTVLLPASGLLAFGITLIAMWGLGWMLKRTLGGQTGDTLGAAIELGEVVFLLALLR